MAKAGLPKSQSPVMQVFIHRKTASETGAAPCVRIISLPDTTSGVSGDVQ